MENGRSFFALRSILYYENGLTSGTTVFSNEDLSISSKDKSSRRFLDTLFLVSSCYHLWYLLSVFVLMFHRFTWIYLPTFELFFNSLIKRKQMFLGRLHVQWELSVLHPGEQQTATHKKQVFAQFINIWYKFFNRLCGSGSESISWKGNIIRPVFFFWESNYTVKGKT